jgi:hypothetical protein
MSKWIRPTVKELGELYKDETVKMSVFVFNLNEVFTRINKIEKNINELERLSRTNKSGVI